MELCTSRVISNLHHHRFFTAKYTNPYHLHSKNYLSPKRTSISPKIPGLIYFARPLLRFATSEETSNSVNEQYEEASDGVITMEKSPTDEQNVPYEGKSLTDEQNVPYEEKSLTDEQNVPYEAIPTEEVPKSETLMGEQMQAFEFLEKLNIKNYMQLDSEDAYSLLIYGSGALVILWLASVILGAIDSIPVFPKALELVGLAFTIWFSSRYLIYKKNREELLAKVEELKQQIIGPTDE